MDKLVEACRHHMGEDEFVPEDVLVPFLPVLGDRNAARTVAAQEPSLATYVGNSCAANLDRLDLAVTWNTAAMMEERDHEGLVTYIMALLECAPEAAVAAPPTPIIPLPQVVHFMAPCFRDNPYAMRCIHAGIYFADALWANRYRVTLTATEPVAAGEGPEYVEAFSIAAGGGFLEGAALTPEAALVEAGVTGEAGGVLVAVARSLASGTVKPEEARDGPWLASVADAPISVARIVDWFARPCERVQRLLERMEK